MAEAKVGNKINLKVTEYKRHKHPASDTGAGIYQIVKAEEFKKVEEAVDLSTLVQELKEAPKVDYVSELVKVEKLKVVSTLTNGENLTLKVDYGSAKNVVLYLPN